jgi:hypothetical protein
VINNVMAQPLKMNVVNVTGGGDSEWALAELEANGSCKNGSCVVLIESYTELTMIRYALSTTVRLGHALR